MELHMQITNVRGLLGINKKDAVLSIRQPKADVSIRTVKPELNMRTEQLRVRIDQSRCFAEAGLKPLNELTEETAAEGRRAVFEAIGSANTKGYMLMNITSKKDAIGEYAASQVFKPPVDWNIAFIPQSRPSTWFEGGTVTFNPQQGRVEIEARANKPEFDVTPPNITYSLAREPYFKINWYDETGRNLDLWS